MPVLLIEGRRADLPPAPFSGGPWAPVAALHELSGWELKPEGACLGDLCVPLPPGRELEFVRDGWFNLGALAAHLSQPVVYDAGTAAWCIGEAAATRAAELDSLVAPDFRLPDWQGVEHQLSDYRGRRVFLVSWASW